MRVPAPTAQIDKVDVVYRDRFAEALGEMLAIDDAHAWQR